MGLSSLLNARARRTFGKAQALGGDRSAAVEKVHRPIVRSFKAKFARNAATWVRSGGHAVFWESPTRARILFPAPKKDDVTDLGVWSVLDLGKLRWEVYQQGTFKGLGTTLVPKDCHDIVRRRAHRDSEWPGPTRTIKFDCLECGACCRDNEVILTGTDLERFAEGGRPELGKAPLAKRKNGKLVLTLLKSKDCPNLGKDNKCGIYTVRPDACREFPVGSECCLFARSSELGLYDGLRPEE